MTEVEKLYTIEETAKILRIGQSTLFKIVKKGEITPIKINSSTLFPISVITNYIEKKKDESQEKEKNPSSPEKGTNQI